VFHSPPPSSEHPARNNEFGSFPTTGKTRRKIHSDRFFLLPPYCLSCDAVNSSSSLMLCGKGCPCSPERDAHFSDSESPPPVVHLWNRFKSLVLSLWSHRGGHWPMHRLHTTCYEGSFKTGIGNSIARS